MVLRGSLLINGGAAIALLAYIGHVAGKNFEVFSALIALAVFAGGGATAVIGVFMLSRLQSDYNTVHISELSEANETIEAYTAAVKEVLSSAQVTAPERPLEEVHRNSEHLDYISNRIRNTTAGIALITFLLFSGGVFAAIWTFYQQSSSLECVTPSQCVKVYPPDALGGS